MDSVAGAPVCACGVSGEAFKLDGQKDFINFTGDYKNIFSSDYTISFYFKVAGNVPGQALDLLSYREDCGLESTLAFTYLPGTKEVSVEPYENVNRNALLVGDIDPLTCWQHVVLVKEGVVMRLYINGRLKVERRNSQTINVTNRGILSLSNSPCLGFAAQRFSGWVDELRIYRGALELKEVVSLYHAPDRIITRDAAEIHVGPYFGYLLSAKANIDGDIDFEEDNSDRSNFKTWDYGISAGVGFNAGPVQIGARYNYGLQKIADSDVAEFVLGDAKHSNAQLYISFNLNQ